MKTRKMTTVLGLGILSLVLSGCGGQEAAAREGAAVANDAATAQAAPGSGKIIEVRMVTNGATNAFEPAAVTASPGDVVRFVLESGVHNVSFAGDQNASAAGLPAASPFLSAPGQTHDVQVTFAPGQYKFQCDPHIMMGMVGTLTVQ